MATNNYFLKELTTGGTVKDYKHAARIFVDANYRLAPKHSFLFHVAFDVDPTLSLQGQEQILEAGLLVKEAQLPQFEVEKKTYNAYNRPNVVQNKIRYNPLEIVFHDDNSDIVRDFWYNYYSFYYRDSDTTLIAQNTPHKYQERMTDSWGYTLRTDTTTPKVLRSIRIYVLHQKRFTEYLLVNPTITRWSGSQMDVSQATATVEARMTVDYEAVIFSSGNLIEDNVPSFFNLHYDREASDITPEFANRSSNFFNANTVGDTFSSLPDLVRTGQAILGKLGVSNLQQSQQFNSTVQNFLSSSNDIGGFGKNILQNTNPFAQIRVPDISNLTKGVSQPNAIGRAVSSLQGIPSNSSISRSLMTPNLTRVAGSISSNQSTVSRTSSLPSNWVSTSTGARPALPALSGVQNLAPAIEQLSAAQSANPGNVETAIIESGYVNNQLTSTNNLFTNSKNLQSDLTVSNLIDKLNDESMQQQAQQTFVEQYLNTKANDSDMED